MWRLIVLIALVGCGYLSYNYWVSKDNQGQISLVMKVVKEGSKKAPAQNLRVENPTHWNLKHHIRVILESPAKIRSYHIKVSTSDHLVVYDKNQIVLDEPSRLVFELPKPSIQLNDQTILHYEISLCDWSNGNFFSGNITTKSFDLVLDTTPPTIRTLAQSSSITYGGSALVVFKVEEDSLDKVWINNGSMDFKVFPFMQDKYYAAILPWSLQQRAFNSKIIARDKSLNTTVVPLSFIQNTRVPRMESKIDLSKQYASKADALQGLKTYPYLERTNMHANLQEIIQQDLSNVFTYSALKFQPFSPLNTSKPRILSPFGAKQSFLFKGDLLGESLHSGTDFFGKHSKVIASNEGRVVLAEEMQSYGKGVLISYGLGLHALYGSLSSVAVRKADLVSADSVLGVSGKNSTSKFDHVHFEVLVQGVSVRPREWMDAGFIQRFNDVLRQAQRRIQEQR
ncbi:M23 family metallopeptidase [Helicobacter salomonis]|uniref:M23 family metallopeptidase n=1 Tax=Helicobacter salomonis TaxID=56878 RepID=UPI000CF04D92|nr:M23 family metallopeptidase [Helicobacter salomonis]